MPLTTDELDLLRQETTSWMTDVCDLYRETTITDAYGGQSTSEALVTESIPCSLQSGVAHEQTVPEITALRNVHVFTVFLPAETDVRVQDNLVLTTQADLKLRVQAVLRPETNELLRPVIATSQL
jgi:hypothetical protein